MKKDPGLSKFKREQLLAAEEADFDTRMKALGVVDRPPTPEFAAKLKAIGAKNADERLAEKARAVSPFLPDALVAIEVAINTSRDDYDIRAWKVALSALKRLQEAMK